MTIPSIQFILFTLLVLAAYYLLSRRLQHYILLIASFSFILFIDIGAGLILLFLTAGNYFFTTRMLPGDTKKKRRIFLWLGILLNAGVWIYFRWVDFFVPYVVYYMKRAGISLDTAILMMVFPVGLSFYIVQAISYLVDVYKGLVKPCEKFSIFALYMLYFPRLISGPIERPRHLIPQLRSQHAPQPQQFVRAFYLILEGLVRKIAFADVLSMLIPADVFSSPSSYPAIYLLFWLMAYAFLLYNDFAGYIAMVRGVSLLFGIDLSVNFRQPYFSRSFTEFWQRWHITLSDWLRDYIFTPLTRMLLRRKNVGSRSLAIILPPLITMLVSGLWHGATWNMLVWGGLHGVFLVLERILNQVAKIQPAQFRHKKSQFLSVLFVFLLTSLAWIPFRMQLPEAKAYFFALLDMQSWTNFLSEPVWFGSISLVAVFIIALTVLLDFYQYRWDFSAWMKKSSLQKAMLINAAVLLVILGFAMRTEAPPPFIYQGF